MLDYKIKPRVKLDGSSVDLLKAKMSMNLFDEIAVGEGIVVSVAHANAQDTLRTAVAMGADCSILVQTNDEVDLLATAKILRAFAIKRPS